LLNEGYDFRGQPNHDGVTHFCFFPAHRYNVVTILRIYVFDTNYKKYAKYAFYKFVAFVAFVAFAENKHFRLALYSLNLIIIGAYGFVWFVQYFSLAFLILTIPLCIFIPLLFW